MSGAVALQARHLYFSYGSRTVLKDISIEVSQGEMLGVVGPNGAGKTTLLRILNGTLRPATGEVRSGGALLHRLRPEEQARRAATVAQNPFVPDGFTALEVVLMGRNPHLRLLQWEGREDFSVAEEVMKLTDTWELARRPVCSLSGGERQRVFIARALAQQAPLLLLDEPTAHLDIGYQAGILDLILEARSRMGMTVIVSMHDLTLAAQYCPRIAMLDHGCIVAEGEAADVLTAARVSAVFKTRVSLLTHPADGTPVVLVDRGAGRGREER